MKKYAKFLVALAAALGVVASSGLLPEPYSTWVTVAVAALGAGMVYLVPNETEADAS